MRIAVIVCSLLLPVVAASFQTDLQPAQMHQDLDVLKRALEETHGGLYRFSTKTEVDRRFAAARSHADRPLSTLAFIGVVSEAIAIVRDGHMRLEYDDATNASLGAARLLPLRVASEGGKVVVAYNDAIGDDTTRPGMKLLSVNGRPVVEITSSSARRPEADSVGKLCPISGPDFGARL